MYANGIFSQIKNDSLLLKLEKSKHDTLKLRMLIEEGDYLRYTFPDSSFVYYKEALYLSRKTKNKKFEAESLLSIGYYLDSKSKYKESLEYYLKAIELYKSINDEQGIANGYNYIAYSFSYLNSTENSIKYYLKAQEIYTKLNDSLGLADIFNGFGDLYYSQENFTKAQEYYSKSLVIFKNNEDKRGLVSAYINIGNTTSEMGNIEKGIEFYNKSIALCNELNDQDGLAINYANIGECYVDNNNFDAALKYLDKSLKIASKINYKQLLPMIYANFSHINIKTNNYKLAIDNAKKSLESVKNVSWADMEYDAHLYLSTAYEKMGDYKKAYKYHKIYKKHTDSIFNLKKVEQLAKLDVLYKLENQESKIETMQRNDEIRNLQNKNQLRIIYILIVFSVFFLILIYVLNKQRTAKIKAYNLMLIEKEKAEDSDRLKSAFLANMSHEIRTPMNAIMGFSNFLKNTSLEPKKRNHFIDIITISGERLMAIINDIIDISKIESNQLKIESKKFNFELTLSEIVEIQKETNSLVAKKELELKLISPQTIQESFIISDENRFSQIINNLISNAIKFSPKKGIIEIGYYLKQYNNQTFIEFYVTDNGKGIPKSKFKFIFERFSQADDNDFKVGNGLGLSICKGLTTLLNGKIWLESEENKGTTFYFTLPY